MQLLQVYRILHLHIYMISFITQLTLPHVLLKMFTCTMHELEPPYVKQKQFIYFYGTQIWNSLNPTLYTAKTLANFKLL